MDLELELVEEGKFVRGRWNLSSVVFLFSFKVILVVFEDQGLEIEINGAVLDLSVRNDFSEQRIGVSHTPVSGGREIQRIRTQVRALSPFLFPLFYLFLFPPFFSASCG